MRLAYRIVLLVLVSIVFSSLAIFLLIQQQQKLQYSDSETLLAQTLVNTLREGLVQDVINQNKIRVTDLLKKIRSHDDPIEFLYIVDESNSIFAHSFENGFPKYLVKKSNNIKKTSNVQLINKYKTQQAVIFEYAEFLIPGLGMTLHIGINQSSFIDKLDVNKRYLISAMVSITVLALLIAYLIVRRIIAPFNKLAYQIQKFGAGKKINFDEINSSDPDIQHVANTFKKAAQERYKALEELRDSQAQVHLLLNSTAEAIYGIDLQGNCTFVNQACLTILGYENTEEVLGQNMHHLIHYRHSDGRHYAVEECHIFQAFHQQKRINIDDEVFWRKDGSAFAVEYWAHPIFKDNACIGAVVTFLDITQRIEALNKLQEREQDLTITLNSIGDGVIATDAQGKVTRMNPTAIKLTGWNIEDASGESIKTVFPIVDESTRLPIENPIEKVLNTGQTVHLSNHTTLIGKDKKEYSISDSAAPIRDNKNNITGMVLVFSDVTAHKQQDEMIRRTQKMDALGKLTGGIAHDYNNMLGVILGYADLLISELSKLNPELNKYASEIQHAAERGSRLTKKLLNFSKHKTKDDTSVFSINDLLNDNKNMLQKVLTARISLQYELTNKLWFVKLDYSELEDVVLNMSINAMHAMEQGGKLNIKTDNIYLNKLDAEKLNVAVGEYVQLSISDTGCGMTKNILEKIFDPFMTTKGDKGVGLGLSQAYGFVERSGGLIKVYSEPARGTRFVIYFPRSCNELANEEISADVEAADFRGSETILVVDDEAAIRYLAADILKPQGYKVLTANDGLEALIVLKTGAVDLLLSDVIMPNMDGYELAEEVMRCYPHIKIQMCSGFSDDRFTRAGNTSLHKKILNKPYVSSDLLSAIRQLLDEDVNDKSSADVHEVSVPKDKLFDKLVMVVDDEEGVRGLFELRLEKLGCRVIQASSAKDATEYYETSIRENKPVDVIIMDLNLSGNVNGVAVAKNIFNIDSAAKIIIASGDTECLEMKKYQSYGFCAALSKTYTLDELKQVLYLAIL